jgi:hypothetical protein
VVLLDFGVIADVRRALEGAAAGTPLFMAPEQADGDAAAPAADWYAVGLVLYLALTGRLPFGAAPLEALALRRRIEPPPPSSLVAGLPDDLDRLCADLLRIEPGERPDAIEILRRLAVQTEPWPEGRFVGRVRELDALERCFAAVRAGGARTLLVHGESGAGKTALVSRFLDRTERSPRRHDAGPVGQEPRAEGRSEHDDRTEHSLPRHDAGAVGREPRTEGRSEHDDRTEQNPRRHDGRAVVLAGRCCERESVPYKAVDEVIDRLSWYLKRLAPIDAAALLPAHGAALALVFPVLQRVPAIAELMAARGEPAHERRRREDDDDGRDRDALERRRREAQPDPRVRDAHARRRLEDDDDRGEREAL